MTYHQNYLVPINFRNQKKNEEALSKIHVAGYFCTLNLSREEMTVYKMFDMMREKKRLGYLPDY